jgi:class 3 adenylate cyclase/tetratricopeptide (TPR) repeat protein
VTTASGADVSSGTDDLAAVDRAIAALEGQRAVLGDDVVSTALAPLLQRRASLVDQQGGEQRKLVTILFSDLVDFTVLSGRLDAEDTRDVVSAYFARWQKVIDAHGGVVEKFIGDAVMAVFGLHQSWEDDAQRAARAALAMVADLEDLNAELRQRYGVTVSMRVGLDTGNVVVSTLGEHAGHDFVAVGQTVNRASRLQAAAPADSVLISVDTCRQLRGRFNVERQEPLQLKGIADPVDSYLLLSERPRGFQFDPAGGVEGVPTPTVGREIELQTLSEWLFDVVEEQRWRVVTLVGDAGVGKSRLLADFETWLADRPEPVYWFRGRASPAGKNQPNALLRDVLGSRFAISETDPPPVVRSKFEEGFGAAFDDAESVGQVELVAAWLGFDIGAPSVPLPSDPRGLRDQGTHALAEYFRLLSGRAPVVLLLEDLHWADDGSIRFLDAADADLRSAPMLVVATTRPTLFEVRPRWSEGLAHHVRVNVEPLSRRQSRLLLQEILRHVDDPPVELIDLVIATSEGNPFYIEELVTWLIDAGVIVKGESSWRVVGELVESVVVPSTLRGVLQARLDALSLDERSLLQRASVVGRVFWDEAVAHLGGGNTPDAGPTHLADVLNRLRGRDLVYEREISAFESAREFLFKHALLRDVAYDGVLRSHRQRFHERAATWLAEVSSRTGRDQEFATLIAEHYDRAGAPEAAGWYLRAARGAASVFALAESTQLLSRGLEVADDPRVRFELLALRESVLDRTGDRVGQARDLDEMDALADRIEDLRLRILVLLGRARQSFASSRYEESSDRAQKAVAAAEEAGLEQEMAQAQLWLGKSETWRDQSEPARANLHKSLELGRRLQRATIIGESLRYLSMLANNEGHFRDALDLAEQARQVFAADGDIESEGMALAAQATTHFNLGRLDEARTGFEQVLPLFRRSGHRYREAVVLGNLATIASRQAEIARAEQWARAAVDATREIGDREGVATNMIILAILYTSVSRWPEAEALLTEALAIARDVGVAGVETSALSQWAVLDLERGNPEDALLRARAAVLAGEQVSSPLDRGHAHLALGSAAVRTGDLAAASTAFATAADLFTEVEVTPLLLEARVGLAEVALAQGRVPDAVALVSEVRPKVDPSILAGVDRPGAMLRTCWQVLASAGDAAADAVLADARRYLLESADAIGDADMRAGFLALPANAELLVASERLPNG